MGQGCVITLAQSDVFEGVSLRITAVAMHRLPFLALMKDNSQRPHAPDKVTDKTEQEVQGVERGFHTKQQ